MSLLPCPFCGSPVILSPPHVAGESDYIQHDRNGPLIDCGLEAFSNFSVDADVSQLWNTRATPTPEIAHLVERSEGV